MNNKNNRPEQAPELRKRAEDIAKEKAAPASEDLETMSPEEMRQMLHKLRAHQIELTMQKEELRRVRLELEISQMRYFDLYDLAPVGYVALSKKGLILEANLTVANLLGVTPGALVKQRIVHFIFPEDKNIYYLYRKRLFETHSAGSGQTGKPQRCELRMVKRDGTEFWVRLEATAMPDADGAPVCRAVISDITERKRAEEVLRESEEYLRSVFRVAPTGIGVVVDRVFKQVNTRMCEMTGYSEEELTGQNARMLYASDEDYEYVGREKYAQIRDHFTGTVETRWKRKDGHIIDVLLSSTPMAVGDLSKGVTFIGLDITERKQAEAEQDKLQTQLIQAQKMEAIGTLAGGIAHNFNNVLMAIQGRISLMLMDKDSSLPDFEHLKCIEDYVKNAAGLTKNLLGFARGGKYEVSPTELNEFIEHESRMFAQTKKELQIHGQYGKDLWAVEIDHGQMKQVLMNLYVNAWQAMPGGGDLHVQTQNVTLDADYVNLFNIAPGRYVKISVTDTGVGMDQATKEKIFVPFFTTQEIGVGSGLGLASVYGIVKNHGGFINVHSKKGEGTTFNIFLPASDKEVLEKKTLSKEIVKGEGTILFVDDEEMITDVGEKLLENLGYSVLVAGSGKEAIEIFKNKNSDIDLVILDMIMPGMGGGETYDRLKEISPGNKFLLSSGYALDSTAQDILDRGCDGFIQKPFSIEAISQKIREILN